MRGRIVENGLGDERIGLDANARRQPVCLFDPKQRRRAYLGHTLDGTPNGEDSVGNPRYDLGDPGLDVGLSAHGGNTGSSSSNNDT